MHGKPKLMLQKYSIGRKEAFVKRENYVKKKNPEVICPH